jgi:hypothetical protein
VTSYYLDNRPIYSSSEPVLSGPFGFESLVASFFERSWPKGLMRTDGKADKLRKVTLLVGDFDGSFYDRAAAPKVISQEVTHASPSLNASRIEVCQLVTLLIHNDAAIVVHVKVISQRDLSYGTCISRVQSLPQSCRTGYRPSVIPRF